MIIDGLNQGILFALLQDKYVPGTYSRTNLNMSSVIVVAGVILLFIYGDLMTSWFSEKEACNSCHMTVAVILNGVILQRCRRFGLYLLERTEPRKS